MHAVNFPLLNPKEICNTFRCFSYLKAECSFQRVREHSPLLRASLPYFTHTFFWQITSYEIRSQLIGQSERKHVPSPIRCDSKNVKSSMRAHLILFVKDEVLCFTPDSKLILNNPTLIIIIHPKPDNAVRDAQEKLFLQLLFYFTVWLIFSENWYFQFIFLNIWIIIKIKKRAHIIALGQRTLIYSYSTKIQTQKMLKNNKNKIASVKVSRPRINKL